MKNNNSQKSEVGVIITEKDNQGQVLRCSIGSSDSSRFSAPTVAISMLIVTAGNCSVNGT